MGIIFFIDKVKRRVWSKIVTRSRKTVIYPYLYRSFWHYKFVKANKGINRGGYLAARPNPGAGIGHQMANWIAGYWWAKQFGLEFAHIPFSTSEWETFLGFGDGEKTVMGLIKDGYKKRTLPLFNENRTEEIESIKS